MIEQQLDLFLGDCIPVEKPLPQDLARRPAVVDLDDEATRAGLVDENQAFRVQFALARTPLITRLGHI